MVIYESSVCAVIYKHAPKNHNLKLPLKIKSSYRLNHIIITDTFPYLILFPLKTEIIDKNNKLFTCIMSAREICLHTLSLSVSRILVLTKIHHCYKYTFTLVSVNQHFQVEPKRLLTSRMKVLYLMQDEIRLCSASFGAIRRRLQKM